jgi:hypothetical protein
MRPSAVDQALAAVQITWAREVLIGDLAFEALSSAKIVEEVERIGSVGPQGPTATEQGRMGETEWSRCRPSGRRRRVTAEEDEPRITGSRGKRVGTIP